ncbi:hypothetical protein BT96DRAFT_999817 [Gymnopus androsaceus JB14]|uniref:G domain-containing protein n=1 Tax=Gymnopus androsaceus JB14 TaxID=1447944 RepID=A0A6A4H753_9AGAR|nr:hypothetical protein BT96DRAFT_999817 [Gymnopus androsaceus JB14]
MDNDQLIPETDILRQECPRARILVIGKSGAGKSALINRVFGIPDQAVTNISHRSHGVHDIEKELTWKSNKHVVIRDSEGFEHGDDGKRKIVEQFVEDRLQMVKLAERLHAIWVCLEIPWSNGRLLDRGIEQFLESISGRAPVVVVFTKLDLLEEKVESELDDAESSLDDDAFEMRAKEEVDSALEELCYIPFKRKINHDYPFIAVSNLERHADRIGKLVKLTLEKCDVESAWVAVAISQRAEAVLNIKASTSFLERLAVLVEDLAFSTSQPEESYHLTSRAVNAIVNNPTVFPVTVPVAVVVFLAEWVLSSYKKTKESLRCLMGFIIDLTLVMDALFYLTRDRTAVSIRHINQAIAFFKSRKARVHDEIRTWVGQLSSALSHLNPDNAVTKIGDIIEKHCINPEEGCPIEASDDEWVSLESLRQ